MRIRVASLMVLAVGTIFPDAGSVAAQEMEIPNVEGEVELDGSPDEAFWRDAVTLPMSTFEPEFGAPITRSSTILIAHDGESLFAAGLFEDDGPVTTNSLIRDYYGEDDLFNLVIDSFDDDETALWFLMTPAGTRIDGAITDDGEGARWNHREFDNVWDAAARVTESGWSAEMRIPFSSLRFRDEGGEVRMGLIAGRMIARLRERHTFPAIRPGPAAAQFKPSLAAPVLLNDVVRGRSVELRPYVIGGFTREPGFDERGVLREAGADARMALGRHSMLNLTANTDFAQAETDDERLNLTRFSLFFPEKRQFFLEQSGILQVGLSEDHQVFYSRSVGLSREGVPERIYGGARITGRSGPWEFGGVSLQSESSPGSKNSTAVRVRRGLLNAQTKLGGVLTTLAGETGGFSGALAVDGDINVGHSQFVSFVGAGSWGDAGASGMSVRVRSEKRDKAGFAHMVDARHVTEGYRPPLGFVQRRGITALEASVSHGAFSRPGAVQQRVWELGAQVVRRALDGHLETGVLGLSLDAARRGGGLGSVELRLRREDVLDAFSIAEVTVPAGTYGFAEGTLTLESPAGSTRRGTLTVSGGEYFDGTRVSVTVSPTWNPSRHLELTADYEANWLRFPGRDQRMRGDIGRLRVRLAPNARLSAYGLVQYNSALERSAANVRLRYNFSEGRDLYVVWNEGWSQSGGSGSRWEAVQRTVQVKYTHATWW